jgi:hypothetical protein
MHTLFGISLILYLLNIISHLSGHRIKNFNFTSITSNHLWNILDAVETDTLNLYAKSRTAKLNQRHISTIRSSLNFGRLLLGPDVMQPDIRAKTLIKISNIGRPVKEKALYPKHFSLTQWFQQWYYCSVLYMSSMVTSVWHSTFSTLNLVWVSTYLK